MTHQPPFAILGFPGEPPRAFTNPRDVLVATRLTELRSLLDTIDHATSRGLHAVGFVSYDAAPAFDNALTARRDESFPLGWFALFDAPAAAHPTYGSTTITSPTWEPSLARPEYSNAIASIRSSIEAGDVYQVNYAFRLRAHDVDPLALHQRLQHALIDTGDHAIVSASPELFFSRLGDHITTKPMKGTAPRGRWLEEDDALAARLSSSEKERAENLMIVDLLRNDLARLAPLDIRVTSLCDVERHPTVLQMTSTIEATLRPDTSTFEIFAALFPSGSVTGAPKVAATRMISQLETSPRGIYCGAIGHIAPNQRATFSVAIRTAVVDKRTRLAHYGIGGGITHDSNPNAEYDEALLKSHVLTQPTPDFDLIETMRLESGRYIRLDRHLARLDRSARYFAFSAFLDAIRLALADFIRPGTWRVRLLVSRSGGLRIDLGTMPKPSPGPPSVPLATESVSSNNRFLFHKTTLRSMYPAGVVLLWNERRELTEFTIGNLVLEIDGDKLTPPIDAGLLPGVFREELLEFGAIHERTLHVTDLQRASCVWLINSLREWVPVRLRE